MAYFTQDYLNFFNELAANNEKAWFDDNRKRYEKEVKAPFQALVSDVIEQLKEVRPDFEMLPKNAIFRINRDVRFSKDKTPYNIYSRACFENEGRKSPYPGYFLSIEPLTIHAGGGLHNVATANLKKVRTHIAERTDEFLELVNASEFQKTFGEIMGESNKRIPKEFEAAMEKTNLIAKKQFFYMSEVDTESVLLGDELLPFLLERFRMATPLNLFLRGALT